MRASERARDDHVQILTVWRRRQGMWHASRHITMRSAEKSKGIYQLPIAFGVVAVVSVGATLAAHQAGASIDEDTASLDINALPSVQHLMNARTQLRRVQRDADVLQRSGGRSLDATLAHAGRMRDEFQNEVRLAGETPEYPGEHEATAERLRPALKWLDDAMRELTDAARTGAPEERRAALHEDVDAAVEEVDHALAQLADINHAGAYAASADIARTRHTAAGVASALAGLSALVAMIASFFAIRAARRHTQALREAAESETRRAAELEVFGERVAHDLLSPLSAVTFALGAIDRQRPDPTTKETTTRARRALERARGMVHGILRFARSGARPASGACSSVAASVDAAVEETLSLEPDSPPTIRVEPFPDCDVACDAATLGVMTSNLLGNAAKHSIDAPVREIVVRVRSSETRVRVEIDDNGPGIPAGFETAVFEPYVRAPGNDRPGLGLGLATVKRIADAHGGKVGVSRKRGGGSVFWFELPRVTPMVESQRDSLPSEAAADARALH